MPKWNDKNSLSWIENIGEVALYVKGEASTRYAVLGLGYLPILNKADNLRLSVAQFLRYSFESSSGSTHG